MTRRTSGSALICAMSAGNSAISASPQERRIHARLQLCDCRVHASATRSSKRPGRTPSDRALERLPEGASADSDRQLAQVVIAQGVMCGPDLIERELVRDVHIERPVTDKRHEPFKELRVGLAVVRLRFDARC